MSEEEKQKLKEYHNRKYREAKKFKYNNEQNSFLIMYNNDLIAYVLFI